MKKYQSEFLNNHLEKTLDKCFHPSVKFNQEYFLKIPHIFYKYRECNENNFEALENQYLWLVTADEFKNDLFDSTMYYDLSTQGNKIIKMLKAKAPEIVLEAAKKEFAKKGFIVDPAIFDINAIINKNSEFIYQNGAPKINSIKRYLLSHGIRPNQIDEYIKAIKFSASEEQMKKTAENFIDKLLSLNYQIQKYHYVTCLTVEMNNDLMWDHYAANKTGFCIGYDINLLKEMGFDKYLFLGNLHPMLYKKRKQLEIDSLLELALNKYMKRKDLSKEKQINVEMHMHIHTKKSKYNYESEWRIIIDKQQISNRKHVFPFTHVIYAGLNIAEENLEKLRMLSAKLKVPLYKQELNRTKSDFTYEKI